MIQNKDYSVSVIVPVRDEKGTIESLVKRLPVMGKKTEIVFVEGHSEDGSFAEIKRVIRKRIRPDLDIKLYKQTLKKGKRMAIELGFNHSKGEIIMILDSDLSVDPETLPRFYKLLRERKCDFVNGTRFKYRHEKGAMRYLNHLGNKFFAFMFSILLRSKVTDTLCGTKVLWSKDYKHIKNATKNFAKFDPYGDFQLYLGAALIGLRIKEVPVLYKKRIYGKSKISRFKDGLRLFCVLAVAFIDYLKAKKKYA